MSQQSTKGQVAPLTTLRALAAFLVFMHHYFPFPSPPSFASTVAREGYFGVGMFFTLSGFLITWRYYDRFPTLRQTVGGLRSFYRRRFARVYPLFLVVFLLALIFGLRKTNVTDLFIQLTLLHSYFERFPAIVIPSWSLTVEMMFYLMAPWLLWLCAASSKPFRAVWLRVSA
ncbi:MAG: acyltransferase, partial [Chloroflexota bacterium]